MNYPLGQTVGVTGWSRERVRAPGDEPRGAFAKDTAYLGPALRLDDMRRLCGEPLRPHAIDPTPQEELDVRKDHGEPMTPEAFLNGFAQAVVDQAFDRAERMLAPWIKGSLPVGGLKRVVRLARGDNPPAVEFELDELADDDLASMRESIDEYAQEEARSTRHHRRHWRHLRAPS